MFPAETPQSMPPSRAPPGVLGWKGELQAQKGKDHIWDKNNLPETATKQENDQ